MKKLAENSSKLENIEERLRAIAEVVCSQRDKGDSPAEYSIHTDGRIRLKQKLKEALEQSKETSIAKLVSFRFQMTGKPNLLKIVLVQVKTSVSWTEYIFGICKPDGRLGKDGSRLCASTKSLLRLVSNSCLFQARAPSVQVYARYRCLHLLTLIP